MNRYIFIFLVMVLAFGLSGCFIPETFDAAIHVAKDGSYTFQYTGTLAYGPALKQIQKVALTPENETKLKAMATELKWPPEFKTVTYEGNARFAAQVEKSGQPNEDYIFINKDFSFLSISHEPDGTIKVSSKKCEGEQLKMLKNIRARIDGHLTISVKSPMKVLDHNARRSPRFLGLFGDYEWDIQSFEDPVLMVIKPAS